MKIWIHIVFTTKRRTPFLRTKEIRKAMFRHIKENAKKKDIYLDSINGYADHAHCLISLGREQSVSVIVQLLKGESSMWFNKQKFIPQHFSWQDDYWAVGVSESHLSVVRNYIHNQEEHHRIKTFQEEIDDFMKKYGWEFIQK